MRLVLCFSETKGLDGHRHLMHQKKLHMHRDASSKTFLHELFCPNGPQFLTEKVSFNTELFTVKLKGMPEGLTKNKQTKG